MKLRDLFELTQGENLINSYWRDRFDKGKIYPYIGIDLIFGNGKRLKIASETIQMSNGSQNIVYEPLLISEPSIQESYNWTGGSPSQRSFTIEIDNRKIDALDIILNGNMIAGSAEMALIDKDVPYEKRYVFMIGDMIGGVSFGATEETIEITVSDPKLTVDKITPEYIATSESLSTLPENQQGLRYPLVFNSWNKVPAILMYYNAFTPKYLVGYGHNITVKQTYLNGDRVFSEEYVQNFGSFTSQAGFFLSLPANSMHQWRVLKEFDELGRPITTIEFLDSDLYILEENTFVDSDSVYCDVVTDQNFSVIELARFLLVNYTDFSINGIDNILTTRSRGKEPNFLSSNVCINGSDTNISTTIEFITSTLFNSFPMLQLAYSGLGIGIVLTNRNTEYSVLSLMRGQNLLYDRVSSLKESNREDLYNRFTLYYDYDAMEDNYKKLIERNSSNHNLCRYSENQVGLRELEPIQAINIIDDQSAEYVIDWLANHYTLTTYSVLYEGSPQLFFMLKVGDNIDLTDDKLSLNKVKGTVESIEYNRGRVEIGFKLWILFDVVSGSMIR